ncbi:MAG TPA: tyrosine-protein phosphatase, partial [Blastocatellia bacterium]|nr:tyrosine-protein phosphatase [Blastocatellia bacterium]
LHSQTFTFRRPAAPLLALPIAFGSVLACTGIGENVAAPASPASVAGIKDSMGPMQIPGVTITNFGIVDGHIFRGEQPGADEYGELKSLGITTVIDLRNDAESFARPSAEAAGLKYVNIPLDSKGTPDDASTARFLATVKAANGDKIYVHCAGGRHRTGSMIALYRMTVDGWSADQAFAEMKAFDYYSTFGHGGHKKYVFDYYARMQNDPSSVPVAFTGLANDSAAAAKAQ